MALALGTAIVLSLACGGGGTSPSGGGGGGGNVTVSGWNPAIPYLGDTVVITGTGFSTVPGENVVKLGSCAPACSAASPFAFTVVAATATQLTVAIPWNYPSGLKPAAARIKVVVNGDSVTTADTMFFKFPPRFLAVTNLDFGGAPSYAVRGGDRIQISAWGVVPSKSDMALTVNGQAATIDSVIAPANGLEGGGALFAKFPLVVYPASYPETDIVNDTAYVSLRLSIRGRHDTLTYRAWRFPKSRFDINSVSGAFPTGIGGTVKASGLNMPGGFSAVFLPTDTIRKARSVLLGNTCSLCDTVQFSVPGDLEAGTWFVHLRLERLVGKPEAPVGAISMQ
ncbi:MAG: hypothetical protein U0133_09840 [Gemmatimonadales bacterium]